MGYSSKAVGFDGRYIGPVGKGTVVGSNLTNRNFWDIIKASVTLRGNAEARRSHVVSAAQCNSNTLLSHYECQSYWC